MLKGVSACVLDYMLHVMRIVLGDGGSSKTK